ncbi:hypothetical protein [Arthrobacter sp. VKM Ac-2550]|uniref:hypothetical protein n=1 Tax=Crystallibacter permensis TaxID=1938888 RepID=UPI00222630C7|nr:hypothetical protein [Arthrobacter sp. VKM Ac-2550]MCW2132935.1 DNA binding domain-containing protein, excisionase family [Arthrobacter sp. VKM Ac-2550]
MNKLYTPKELAERFEVTPDFVRERARRNEWPSQRFGERTIRFTENHVNQILARTESKPAGAKGGTRKLNQLLNKKTPALQRRGQ